MTSLDLMVLKDLQMDLELDLIHSHSSRVILVEWVDLEACLEMMMVHLDLEECIISINKQLQILTRLKKDVT